MFGTKNEIAKKDVYIQRQENHEVKKMNHYIRETDICFKKKMIKENGGKVENLSRIKKIDLKRR